MPIGVNRVSGDAHGVVNVDQGVHGSGDQSAAVLHSITGKKPQFVAIVIKTVTPTVVDISNELDPKEMVEQVLNLLQAKISILAYQIEAAGGQISLMFEGEYTAANIQTDVRALGTTVGTNNIDVSGSTVTDVGFKLALS